MGLLTKLQHSSLTSYFLVSDERDRASSGIKWGHPGMKKNMPSKNEIQLIICYSSAQIQKVDLWFVLVQEENCLIAVAVLSGFIRGRWLSVNFGVKRPFTIRQKRSKSHAMLRDQKKKKYLFWWNNYYLEQIRLDL